MVNRKTVDGQFIWKLKRFRVLKIVKTTTITFENTGLTTKCFGIIRGIVDFRQEIQREVFDQPQVKWNGKLYLQLFALNQIFKDFNFQVQSRNLKM